VFPRCRPHLYQMNRSVAKFLIERVIRILRKQKGEC
jgi:hypothetical protein